MAEQITLGPVTLPVDMEWTDEYRWSPILTSQEYTLSGALLIESAEKLAGRPVTLAGQIDGNTGFALVTRATVDALMALLDPPGQTWPLTLADDRVINVGFRGDVEQPIEAAAQKHIVPHVPEDLYTVIIRLQEIPL